VKRNRLIFNHYMVENQYVINFVDVGARGDIEAPWNLFPEEALRVIGFEPDKEETVNLSNKFSNRKYYPHALWGSCSQRKYYLNSWASTSSMYPPNKTNDQYEEQHWAGRIIEKEVTVPCLTLDSIIDSEDVPDFIKIDAHGAELEILKGSINLLTVNAPLVLVETWCAEIYKGIPQTHDIMRFMAKIGYQVFDINVAAAWKHANRHKINIFCKSKTIGFDLLFVKRIDALKDLTPKQFVKLVALCELYGFRDYSLFLLENLEILHRNNTEEIRKILLSNNSNERSVWDMARHLLSKVFCRNAKRYPALH